MSEQKIKGTLTQLSYKYMDKVHELEEKLNKEGLTSEEKAKLNKLKNYYQMKYEECERRLEWSRVKPKWNY